MTEVSLDGTSILIVEDEYFLAEDLRDDLTRAGAKVLQPVGNIDRARDVVRSGERIDAAVLDINLDGEMVFPIADALRERGIPFVFATGYDRSVLPERFLDTPRVEKPFKSDRLAAVLKPLLAR